MFFGGRPRTNTRPYDPSHPALTIPLAPQTADATIPVPARPRRRCREMRALTPHTLEQLSAYYRSAPPAELTGAAAAGAARRLWQRILGGVLA